MSEPTAQTELVKVWDAEYCPDPLPDDYTACMVYIGGSSAAHVWTADELQRVAHLPRLPVWVPTPGHENPRQVAMQADRRMAELGIPRGPQVDGEKVGLMWDMETGTEPDPRWLSIAAHTLTVRERANLPYGSAGTLYREPARAGYVLATDDHNPEIPNFPNTLANQYWFDLQTPGGLIDVSVFKRAALRYFWHPES